ncbi:MAG: hypothetical protein KBC72_04230 [Acinetobacter sp.]|nr:hypothetical protein [Acinetobacter sp.]
MKINLTNELSNLLFFTGETATAIRMYSCYAKNPKYFTTQDSLDLMFLSDILHYFSQLHFQIIQCDETGKYSSLIETCKRIISQLNDLTDEKMQAKFSRSAIATFENPQNASLVDLKLAIASLESIIQKCEKL